MWCIECESLKLCPCIVALVSIDYSQECVVCVTKIDTQSIAFMYYC